MSLDGGDGMLIFTTIIAGMSLVANGVLIWYIRKLLAVQEDLSVELAENIYAFQEELEGLLDTDVLTGEPTLVKLLEDVREFGVNTENIRLKLIPQINEDEGERKAQ